MINQVAMWKGSYPGYKVKLNDNIDQIMKDLKVEHMDIICTPDTIEYVQTYGISTISIIVDDTILNSNDCSTNPLDWKTKCIVGDNNILETFIQNTFLNKLQCIKLMALWFRHWINISNCDKEYLLKKWNSIYMYLYDDTFLTLLDPDIFDKYNYKVYLSEVLSNITVYDNIVYDDYKYVGIHEAIECGIQCGIIKDSIIPVDKYTERAMEKFNLKYGSHLYVSTTYDKKYSPLLCFTGKSYIGNIRCLSLSNGDHRIIYVSDTLLDVNRKLNTKYNMLRLNDVYTKITYPLKPLSVDERALLPTPYGLCIRLGIVNYENVRFDNVAIKHAILYANNESYREANVYKKHVWKASSRYNTKVKIIDGDFEKDENKCIYLLKNGLMFEMIIKKEIYGVSYIW